MGSADIWELTLRWKGPLLWAIILTALYRAAPRIAPHSPRLARFAIGCFALILPDGFCSALQARPVGYDPAQGFLFTALDVAGVVGVFAALICGAFVCLRRRAIPLNGSGS